MSRPSCGATVAGESNAVRIGSPARAAPRPVPDPNPPGRALRPAHLVLLLALFALEATVVTIRHWWVDLLGDFRDLSALAITLAVVIGVFAGDRLRRVVELAAAHGRTGFPWGPVVLQVGAFVGFVLFTRHVVSTGLHRGPSATAWLTAWAGAGAGVLALWGWALLPWRGWRELVRRGWTDAVLAVLVVAVAWGASRYTQHLWQNLTDDTLRAVEHVLRLLFADVTVEPENRVIGARGFLVRIAPSCSGYEGFGLVAAVVGSYLWLCRRALRFPAALVLLPLGLAASWVLNVLRITALIAIGAHGWPVVAVNGFHTQAGWLAFNAVALGLVVLSRSSSLFCRSPIDRTPRGPNPAAPLLVPLLVIVGTAMVTGAASGALDRLYAVRVLTAGLVLWAYRSAYADLGWSWSWVALGAGAAVFGIWIGLEALLPPGDAPGDPQTLPTPERWIWLVGRIVGAVVLVPLAEELAFRAYLLRRLQGAELNADMTGRWNWFAVLVSSALFGLLHSERWVAGTLAGALYARVFSWRGRLSDAVLAHAATNALLAGYVLATGHWALW
jgi:exosortase E/protease (VPEID-CTERM system)